jgi:hypothetical protein
MHAVHNDDAPSGLTVGWFDGLSVILGKKIKRVSEMFWNKQGDSSSLGVPFDDLLLLLQPTSIKASLKGSTLVAKHEHYTIRAEVVPPANHTEDSPIRAVVRMTTDLPKPVAGMFNDPESTIVWNAFAALGAISYDQGTAYIGSRLTIYKAEDAWRTLQLPLLMFTIICGSEAILGGMRRVFAKEGPRGGLSKWTEGDFKQVESYLSRLSVCTTGGLGLTSEFGLTKGAVSAAAGDSNTALLQMAADQPHPELGGGLFVLLQMPHQLQDQKQLRRVCVQLNNMEMAAHDLPPHFGGWCEGRRGNNPAYVSFFPNPMYSISGIALNAAIGAMHRAQQANLMLESLGYSLPSAA